MYFVEASRGSTTKMPVIRFMVALLPRGGYTLRLPAHRFHPPFAPPKGFYRECCAPSPFSAEMRWTRPKASTDNVGSFYFSHVGATRGSLPGLQVQCFRESFVSSANHPISGPPAKYFGVKDVLSAGWSNPKMTDFLQYLLFLCRAKDTRPARSGLTACTVTDLRRSTIMPANIFHVFKYIYAFTSTLCSTS